MQAEVALEQIREKAAHVAIEYSQGKLNRAQFLAIYAHYNEKRTIIERLLARDPDTHAWESVLRSGHTSFLREHFEARVLSYAIYDQRPDHLGKLINSQGNFLLPQETAAKILQAIAIVRRNHRKLSTQRRPIENGWWAVFIPGTYTTAIVVFSLEPSARQVERVSDLHRDFERANHLTLARSQFQAEELVYPHRALFEKPS